MVLWLTRMEADGTAPGGPAGPPPPPADAPPASGVLRLGFIAAFVVLGVLLAVSARSAPPPEARLGQRVELVELIRAEQSRTQALSAKVEELTAELAGFEREVAADITVIAALQEQVDELAAPAGLVPLQGPGVVATLTDSRLSPASGEDVNDYVIHEQDLQGVINALWAGGAEAMAVNGHRILSTTAIRCVGNVLLLHGTTHSPPYVIEAVGDEASLREALGRDPAVARFERAVSQFQLGFTVEADDVLYLPGYEGSVALQVARPVEGAAS